MTMHHIQGESTGADEHAAASLADFPYEPHFHDVLGARMAVVDEGAGHEPPLVLLHGNPTWSYVWRKVIRIMAPERGVNRPRPDRTRPLGQAGHRVSPG